jgi:hypothetical protein
VKYVVGTNVPRWHTATLTVLGTTCSRGKFNAEQTVCRLSLSIKYNLGNQGLNGLSGRERDLHLNNTKHGSPVILIDERNINAHEAMIHENPLNFQSLARILRLQQIDSSRS